MYICKCIYVHVCSLKVPLEGSPSGHDNSIQEHPLVYTYIFSGKMEKLLYNGIPYIHTHTHIYIYMLD